MTGKIIECVPNFSEGRDRKKVDVIADVLSVAEGVKLLDYSMDEDHNRSVFTFIGDPRSIESAALKACNRALELIDMRCHHGAHPRIGAVDVVPFIPLRNATMDAAVETAHRFGRAFAHSNSIPVFFYGEAALDPKRKILSSIRKGGYERLSDKLIDPRWRPDAGPVEFNAKSGATCVGARTPLVAFNINLNTEDIGVAKDIAASIRESGGGLKCVQAMCVTLKSRRMAQVSMNLTDCRQTPIGVVFDVVKEKAAKRHVEIVESELIGLATRDAFVNTTSDYLKLKDFSKLRIIEEHFE